jgi:excisionase family DNA binding protein
MNQHLKSGGVDLVTSLTGYSKSTIYKLVMNNRIPVHRIPGGAKLLFYETEILDWIKSGNVEQKKSAVSYE